MVNGMEMWKGNGNTTTIIFPEKLEILNQERRGQGKPILMEHLNSILFHKSRPDIKQHTNHSIICRLEIFLCPLSKFCPVLSSEEAPTFCCPKLREAPNCAPVPICNPK